MPRRYVEGAEGQNPKRRPLPIPDVDLLQSPTKRIIERDRDKISRARMLLIYRENELYAEVAEEMRRLGGKNDFYAFVIPEGTESLSDPDRIEIERLRARFLESRRPVLMDNTSYSLLRLEKGGEQSLDDVVSENSALGQMEGANPGSYAKMFEAVGSIAYGYGLRRLLVVMAPAVLDKEAKEEENDHHWKLSEGRGTNLSDHRIAIEDDEGKRVYEKDEATSARDFGRIFRFIAASLSRGYAQAGGKRLTVAPAFVIDNRVYELADGIEGLEVSDVALHYRGKITLSVSDDQKVQKTGLFLDRHSSYALNIKGENLQFGALFKKHESTYVSECNPKRLLDRGERIHLTEDEEADVTGDIAKAILRRIPPKPA